MSNKLLEQSLIELQEYYPEEKENLFLNDFPLQTREEWLQEIYKVLEKSGKSKDIETISWKTLDGLTIYPFYRKEDLQNLEFVKEHPGFYPFSRGKKFSQNWDVLQYIQGNSEEVLEKLEQTQRRGADGVILAYGKKSYPYTFYGKGVDNFVLENNKYYSKEKLFFIGSSKDLYELLHKNISGNIIFDPFLDFILEGNYSIDLEAWKKWVENHYQTYPFSFIAIRGDIFQNTGIPPSMEMGIMLSMFSEILYQFSHLDIYSLLSKIIFVHSIDSYYFLEIAKLRSFRRLIALVLKGYNIEDYKNTPRQLGVNSLFHHSIYDIYNNMLRNTIAAMGAIMGGVDSLVILPIDAVFNKDDEFTRRMAINTQLILKHESHFHYVTDPAGGSYYIENVTDLLSKKAWDIFLEIENQGGFKNCIESGWLQNKIKEIQIIRIEQIKSRKEFLLGVNQFPNPKDFIIKEYENFELIGKYKQEGVKTVTVFRAPIFFEELRLQTEKLSIEKGLPVIQLIPYGNLAMQRARASFILNFFGCGGFKVEDPGNLKDKNGILEFLNSIKNKKIDMFVLCSADNEYPNMYKEIKEELQKFNKPILIAGLPESKEELQSSGIYDFIHIKSNLYDTLLKYQKLLFDIS